MGLLKQNSLVNREQSSFSFQGNPSRREKTGKFLIHTSAKSALSHQAQVRGESVGQILSIQGLDGLSIKRQGWGLLEDSFIFVQVTPAISSIFEETVQIGHTLAKGAIATQASQTFKSFACVLTLKHKPKKDSGSNKPHFNYTSRIFTQALVVTDNQAILKWERAYQSHSKGRSTRLPLVPPCLSSLPLAFSTRSMKKLPESAPLCSCFLKRVNNHGRQIRILYVLYLLLFRSCVTHTSASRARSSPSPHSVALKSLIPTMIWQALEEKVLTSVSICLLSAQALWLAGRMVPSVSSISAGCSRTAVSESPERLQLLGLCALPLWDPGFKSKQFFLFLISHIKLLIGGGRV